MSQAVGTDIRQMMEDAVRSVYLSCRAKHLSRYSGTQATVRSSPRWDGGEDRASGRTYRSVWKQIVDVATRRGVDPVRLVAAVFAYAVGPRPPDPAECCSDRAIDQLTNYLQESREQAEGLLMSNREVEYKEVAFILPAGGASSQQELDDACRKAIGLARLQLSPLYRACRARQLNDVNCYQRYITQAVMQLQAYEDVYRESWGSFIPVEVLQAAEQVRSAGSRK